MGPLIFGDYPVYKQWIPSIDGSTASCDLKVSPKPDGALFDFQPLSLQFPEAQAFAASNPNPDPNGLGSRSGPTGVYISSTDFASLYTHDCVDHSSAPDYAAPCLIVNGRVVTGWRYQMRSNCSARIKETLQSRYGKALMPSAGHQGTGNGACGYHW